MNRNWIISQYCENPPRYDLSHCQDVCAAYTDGEISVMALCGGAEEGSLSHIGAECVAEFSVQYFTEHFDQIFEAEFNVACEELIKYHQAMISKLAEVALAKKGVQILVGRNIQIRELNKFASTVQLLAVKDDRAVYFKVGNGSAVIAPGGGVFTLSDSTVRESCAYITTPNPVNLLIGCDFKTFTLSPSCNAIALATDGVEFEGGLFHNHAATPFYAKVIADIADSDSNSDLDLQELASSLLCDNMNALKDNIGISIMHRKPIEEAPVKEEPEVEIVEEPVDEEIEVEIVEEPVDEEIEVEIVEEPVDEEIEVEIVEEPADEEIEVEIVEEPVNEEIEIEIVEEPVEEEPEVEIVEEPVEEEPEVEIVEEPVDEEIEVEIVEEPVDEEIEIEIVEEPEIEIVEEPAEEEPEVEIVEEIVAEEPEVEIVEDIVAEEPEVEIVEEPVAEEPEVEIVEEIVAEEPEVEIVEEPVAEVPEEVLEEVEIEIIDDEEETETEKNEGVASAQKQEKKVSRTILKFFNVSIKKK